MTASVNARNLLLPDFVKMSQALNFEIAGGSICRITGRSGSGKTTLLHVISGIESPGMGEITIEGASSRNFIKDKPGEVSLVPQFPQIISGTVLQNITLNTKSNSVDEKCLHLLELVGLKEWAFDLDQGLHSNIENGSLSGGQKQRIGLARALYTNPSLLLLDEPMSALDENARSLLGHLLSSLEGVTVIYVSHVNEKSIKADMQIALGVQN